MKPTRVLFVGVRDDERSWLKSWFTARGARAWFADRALSAMRVFEELEPDLVVIDTLLDDADPVRIARVFTAARPSCRVTFVGNHEVEHAYFSDVAALPGAGFAFRPLDAETFVGASNEPSALVGVAARDQADGFGLARVLFACERNAFTGCLYVGEGASRRVVHWREGAPIFVESMIPSENFGRLLMEWDIISRVEFEWARNLQLAEGIRQGEALIKIGVLTPESLQTHLRRQFGAKLANALQIAPLPYRIESGTARVRGGGRAINVLRTCIEGLTRIVAKDDARWAQIEAKRVFVPPAQDAATEAQIDDALDAELRDALRRPVTPAELVASGRERSDVHGVYEALLAGDLLFDAAPARASA